jgi:hypothetical protein
LQSIETSIVRAPLDHSDRDESLRAIDELGKNLSCGNCHRARDSRVPLSGHVEAIEARRFQKGIVTMTDIKFSSDLTLLAIDELSGVNGGFLTGSGGCSLPASPKPTSAPSAYETSTATHWNWGGPHNVRLTC